MFALIPAGGSGSRIAGDAPKQYLRLAGRPMLWHAIRAVCVPPVETVFVVLSPDDAIFPTGDWKAFAGKLEPLYCGGETRRDSVYNGLVAAHTEVNADDWVLVQAMDGKPRVVHVMIDAGMTRVSAKTLPLSEKGIKLVFSRRMDRPAHEDPFSIRARWQPICVAEMNGQKTSRVIDLNQGSFLGNPVMPVF